MKHYLQLQWHLLLRRITDFGLQPVWAGLGALLLLLGGYRLLAERPPAFGWVVVGLYASLVLPLAEADRTGFLRQHFGKARALQLRLIENGLLGVPLAALLLALQAWWPLTGLGAVVIAWALLPAPQRSGRALPVPFSGQPWEFPLGFRRWWPVLALALLLLVMAIRVGNANLALFSQALLGLSAVSFYTPPEPDYLVWVHAISPRHFLRRKLTSAMIMGSALVLPMGLAVALAFPPQAWVAGIIWLVFLPYCAAYLLGRYAAFPRDRGLPDSLLLSLSLLFPPLLLVVLPMNYHQAIHQLRHVLPSDR